MPTEVNWYRHIGELGRLFTGIAARSPPYRTWAGVLVADIRQVDKPYQAWCDGRIIGFYETPKRAEESLRSYKNSQRSRNF